MTHEKWRELLENEVTIKNRLDQQLYEMERELRLARFFDFSRRSNLKAMIANKKHEINIADQHNAGMIRSYLRQVKLETQGISV